MMTAIELDQRFQLLAMDTVRFMHAQGATPSETASALEALREVQGRVMGFAGRYPVLDTCGLQGCP
ncbi:hypothetical protein AB0K94_26155 [Streptomyces sp. NPDC053794]